MFPSYKKQGTQLMHRRIDPLISREKKISRAAIQILCRWAKNNPLYVGDPGGWQNGYCRGDDKTDC